MSMATAALLQIIRLDINSEFAECFVQSSPPSVTFQEFMSPPSGLGVVTLAKLLTDVGLSVSTQVYKWVSSFNLGSMLLLSDSTLRRGIPHL